MSIVFSSIFSLDLSFVSMLLFCPKGLFRTLFMLNLLVFSLELTSLSSSLFLVNVSFWFLKTLFSSALSLDLLFLLSSIFLKGLFGTLFSKELSFFSLDLTSLSSSLFNVLF
jgi:hypothetical protein